MNTRACWHLAAPALLLAVSGCGGSLVKVSGKLTYQGHPVPNTLVTFYPEDAGKRPSHGITNDKGHFELAFSSTEAGALRGKHIVFLKYHVTAAEETGAAKPKASKELKAAIAKYGDLKTSPLHYEVTKSGDFIDINLDEHPVGTSTGQ